MSQPYTRRERQILRLALEEGRPLCCPVCGADLTSQAVDPRPDVPYIRHRVWVLCPVCQRTASLDREG